MDDGREVRKSITDIRDAESHINLIFAGVTLSKDGKRHVFDELETNLTTGYYGLKILQQIDLKAHQKL